MEINGIAHTFVTVGDFDRSRAFYSKLLPFLGLKNVMDIPGTYYCVGGRTGFAIRRGYRRASRRTASTKTASASITSASAQEPAKTSTMHTCS